MQEKVFLKVHFSSLAYNWNIIYSSWGKFKPLMRYLNSRIGERVMRKLADIASFAVKKTGIFHNAETRPVDGNATMKGK